METEQGRSVNRKFYNFKYDLYAALIFCIVVVILKLLKVI